MLSDPDNLLVFKPCTPSEIKFYDAANAEYPALAYFMPKFMGTLQLQSQVTPVTSTTPSAATSVTSLPHTNGGTSSGRFPGRIPSPLNLKSANGATPSIPEHSVPDPPPISPSQVSLPVPRSPLGHRRTPSPTLDPLYRIKGKKLSTDTCIVLSAVTAGFSRPNILDLKLGSRLWADDAPPAKKARLDRVSKETTSSSLGFRVAGMRIWPGDEYKPDTMYTFNGMRSVTMDSRGRPVVKLVNGETGAEYEDRHFEPDLGYLFYNKIYGRDRTVADIKDAFRDYFVVESSGVEKKQALEVIRRCKEDVEDMQVVLEGMETRMYSSSILIVYEGDPEAWREAKEYLKKAKEREEAEDVELRNGEDIENLEEYMELGADEAANGYAIGSFDQYMELETGEVEAVDEKPEPNTHAVKLIDFAHADFVPGAGPDENVLHGVRSTVQLLKELESDLLAELQLESNGKGKAKANT